MGMFDQNGGRLPPANTPMGAGPNLGGMRAPTDPMVPPQMGMGASQATPAMPVGQPAAMPPQMGQRPYQPLNFGGMGRPQLPPGVGGMPMQRPDMPQRPMPPQAMGGMALGNADPGQIRQQFQAHLANGGQLPPIPSGMDPQMLRQGMAKLGLDPSHLDNAMQRGPALANALMQRR